MDITFLGTGSAQPSATRNHQAIALRVDGDVWLFDCGEATQHQFQKSKLKMGKVTRIFITHMHGDHCFGLGPLLCSMTDNLNPANATTTTTAADTAKTPIDIYGPTPIRSWLRNTLKSTYSNLGQPYRVHELLLPDDPVDTNQDLHHDELPGENISLVDGCFTLPMFESAKKGYSVQAAPIVHSIPSLGFVIREPDWPGKVNQLIPLIKKNSFALKELGITNPMSLLGQIQRTNEAYTLPDGQLLTPPPLRRGREVVILGDTKDPSAILHIAREPALLVHESTNALTRLDTKEGCAAPTLEEIETRTKDHGHSTPQMAAAFAKKIKCKKLILTHFSARYRGDEQEESLQVMEEIRKLAIDVFDQRSEDIYCARDLWSYEIKMDH